MELLQVFSVLWTTMNYVPERYEVTVLWEGELFCHRDISFEGALEWARAYPGECVVRVWLLVPLGMGAKRPVLVAKRAAMAFLRAR